MRSDADVVIAGGGPAGSLTACLLARRGARVTIVDRARFPRPKLCGDTLNPGAVGLLARHFDLAALVTRGRPLDGWVLTGPNGACVRGAYARSVRGLAITRDVLDLWLIEQAAAAGASVIEAATVVAPVDAGGAVGGVLTRDGAGHRCLFHASVTIGADGRRSRLAQACELSRVPAHPRRWAAGGYFSGVDEMGTLGEMHVRAGHYIGVAPLRDGRVNVCLVRERARGDRTWRDPAVALREAVAADPVLGPRFTRARLVGGVASLGPLAVDTPRPGCAGLLLVGDAAGFIDPITGDGIHLALRSAEVAAAVAGDVLEGRVEATEAHAVYGRALARRLAGKRRFNRAVRRLTSSAGALDLAAYMARVWPAPFAAVIRYAGDCGVATPSAWLPPVEGCA